MARELYMNLTIFVDEPTTEGWGGGGVVAEEI